MFDEQTLTRAIDLTFRLEEMTTQICSELDNLINTMKTYNAQLEELLHGFNKST